MRGPVISRIRRFGRWLFIAYLMVGGLFATVIFLRGAWTALVDLNGRDKVAALVWSGVAPVVLILLAVTIGGAFVAVFQTYRGRRNDDL